jgi:hypothetical protein
LHDSSAFSSSSLLEHAPLKYQETFQWENRAIRNTRTKLEYFKTVANLKTPCKQLAFFQKFGSVFPVKFDLIQAAQFQENYTDPTLSVRKCSIIFGRYKNLSLRPL